MPADLRDLVGQLEAGGAELPEVAVRLAVGLCVADTESAAKAAKEIEARRAGLGESTLLQAGFAAHEGRANVLRFRLINPLTTERRTR